MHFQSTRAFGFPSSLELVGSVPRGAPPSVLPGCRRTPEALAGLLRDKYGGAIDKAHLFPVIKPSGSGRSKLGKALGDGEHGRRGPGSQLCPTQKMLLQRGSPFVPAQRIPRVLLWSAGLAAALGRTNYAHTFTDGVLGRWAGLGGAVSPDFYQAAHQKAAKLGFGTPVKPYAEADQDIYMLRLAVANVVGDPADKPPAPSPLSVPESPDSTANLAPEPPAPSPTANNAALDTLQGRAEEHARQLVDLDKRVTRLERFLRLLRLLLWLAEVLFVTVLYAALLGLLALSVAFFGPHGIAPALPVSVATNTTPTTALAHSGIPLPALPHAAD